MDAGEYAELEITDVAHGGVFVGRLGTVGAQTSVISRSGSSVRSSSVSCATP